MDHGWRYVWRSWSRRGRLWAEEERRTGYYTVVDADTGQVIWRTGLMVRAGDEYLTANNLRYRVTRLDGGHGLRQVPGPGGIGGAHCPSRATG